jgi:hypothetical protein
MNPKEKERELNRILSFIYEDLDSLPFQDKVTRAIEFSFGHDTGLFLDEDAMRDSTHKKKFRGLLRIQTRLREYVHKIMSANPGMRFPIPPLKREFVIGDSFSVKYSTPEDRIIDDERSPDASVIIAEFDELLDGFPRSIRKVCPECGRIYAYIAKKRKDYCSPKCAYKFLSRKRREGLKKHPRKYKAFLKRQRESMHRVYVKQQHEKFGPNVKVGRNGKED